MRGLHKCFVGEGERGQRALQVANRDRHIMRSHQLLSAKVQQVARLHHFEEVDVVVHLPRATSMIQIVGKDHTPVRRKVDVIAADDAVARRVTRAPSKCRRGASNQR